MLLSWTSMSFMVSTPKYLSHLLHSAAMYATVSMNHCEEGSFQAELQTMWDVNFDHDENHVSNSFRKSNEKIQQELQSIDITKLKPHDPYFLLIPWPKENGPEARAYANHYNWKRGLSDSERMLTTLCFFFSSY